MVVPLLIVIALVLVYIAYLLGEIRDEVQAIDRNIPRVDLSSLDSIAGIMQEEQQKRDPLWRRIAGTTRATQELLKNRAEIESDVKEEKP